MRSQLLLLPAVLAGLFLASSGAGAEVLRCEDAAGKVSYTDGACPAGTRPQRSVSTQAPVSVLPDPQGDRARAAREREAQDSAALRPPPPSAPTGAVIIDGRGSGPSERSEAQRWDTDRGSDPVLADEGYYPYPYPYAGGANRPPPPPRDMRPRIRNCDATGCTDTQGNTYNPNSGQLDRYRSIDGKNCRPVGTTTVCR
jgi:hypothetical protein